MLKKAKAIKIVRVSSTIFTRCARSAIFRVPVIMYIKPTAIKIKVAPIVPMIRYL